MTGTPTPPSAPTPPPPPPDAQRTQTTASPVEPVPEPSTARARLSGWQWLAIAVVGALGASLVAVPAALVVTSQDIGLATAGDDDLNVAAKATTPAPSDPADDTVAVASPISAIAQQVAPSVARVDVQSLSLIHI